MRQHLFSGGSHQALKRYRGGGKSHELRLRLKGVTVLSQIKLKSTYLTATLARKGTAQLSVAAKFQHLPQADVRTVIPSPAWDVCFPGSGFLPEFFIP